MPVVINGTTGVTTPGLDASGTNKFATTIGVGGATPSGSGAGITFPATVSSSNDANTLDDYEEGAWTPTLNTTNGNLTGFSYSNRTGTYIKIGRIVTVSCNLSTSNASGATGSGVLHVTGLPFPVADSIGNGRNTLALTHDGRWANNPSFGQVQGDATAIKLYRTQSMNGEGGNGSAMGLVDMNKTNLGNHNILTIMFTYET